MCRRKKKCVVEINTNFFVFFMQYPYSSLISHPSLASLVLFPKHCFCSWHVHQRMNANGNWHQIIYFPETIIQWTTILVIDMLHYDCPMHNDTYSVHNSSLKLWWSRSLCAWSFCYVFSPPLSRLNWCSSFPFGGPGPPTPKMATPLLGSTHTPSPESRTVSIRR